LSWAAIRVFRVIRVPCFETRITHNNFGYSKLEPELMFGFFGLGFFGFGLGFLGFGFRVSCILPSHTPLHLRMAQESRDPSLYRLRLILVECSVLMFPK